MCLNHVSCKYPRVIYLLICLAISTISLAELTTPAFPEAEGAGKYTVGGRGGQVLFVTNLNNSGPGSFRAACEAYGPRIVVFRVSGTITLTDWLWITNPYITIAGQTAPGDGICIKRYPVYINTDQVIIRHMRFRPGDDANRALDSLWIINSSNVIVDHCSASWSTDETLSVTYNPTFSGNVTNNVTVQWCFITESLNYNVTGDSMHGCGGLALGSYGANYSYHHNLYAHHGHGRSPRPGNNTNDVTDPDGLFLDFRNNVLYNWGDYCGRDRNSYVGQWNFINNYYISGLDSWDNYAFDAESFYPRAYWSGNYMNGYLPADQWSLVNFNDTWFTWTGEWNIWTESLKNVYKSSMDFETAPVITHGAETAYGLVLDSAGATLPKRDSVDARVVNDVINVTGHYINSESEVGGWPTLNSLPYPADDDDDGMPNDWENLYGLNPYNYSDNSGDLDGDGYTNIEEYLNKTNPTIADYCTAPFSSDLNSDCKVDLADFAIMSENWMTCNRIPASKCNQ